MRRNGLMKRGFALLLATVLMFGEMDVRTFAEGETKAEVMEAKAFQTETSETDIDAPSEKSDLMEIEDSDIATVSGDNAIENSLGDQEYKDSEEIASASDAVNTYAAEENIASGSYGNITWVIDSEGKLTVSGSGEFTSDICITEVVTVNGEQIWRSYRAPWDKYRKSIVSAKIQVSELEDASYMFAGCDALKSIDLSEFDTSSTYNMICMFQGCSSLTSIDLSKFKTPKVKYMNSMFAGCSSLTSINLNSFQVLNVVYMDSMFEDCSSLKSIDLSNLYTAEVCTYSSMFEGCSNLVYANLEGIKIRAEASLDDMFKNCKNLQFVNFNSIYIKNEIDSQNIFAGCESLVNIKTLSRLDNTTIPLIKTFYDEKDTAFDSLSANNTNKHLTSLKRTELYKICFEPNISGTSYVYPKNAYEQYAKPDQSTQLIPNLFKRNDYTYKGWNTKADGTGTSYSDISNITAGSANSTLTLYAQWEEIPKSKYTIHFDGNGATEGEMSDIVDCSYSMEYTLPENKFKQPSYDFIGWNTHKNGDGMFFYDKEVVANLTTEDNATVTLYAQWEKILDKYTITYHLFGGENIYYNPEIYDESQYIDFSDAVRTGYKFEGWYTDTSYKTAISEIKAGTTGDLNLYAKWSPIKYSIIFEGNGNDSGIMSSMQDCTYGTKYTLHENKFTRLDHAFVGWNTNADGSGLNYKNLATVENLGEKDGTEIKLYAQWKKGAYAITYYINGGYNNSANPDWYAEDSNEIILQNPDKPGCTFDGWYADPKFTNAANRITKGSSGNKIFYAKWIASKYNVQFKKNGATSGKMVTVKNCFCGDTYYFKTNKFKKKGFSFTGWNTKPDGSGESYADGSSLYLLTPPANNTLILYAQWEMAEYVITYQLNGGYNSTLNPHSYNAKTSTISLKKPVRTGYTFSGWYKDSKYKSKVTSIKKGSTGNRTLYAKWKKTKYKITYKLNGGKMFQEIPNHFTMIHQIYC